MRQLLDFQPFPLFSNQHAQTVIASRFRFASEPPSKTRIIALPDGDKLALEVSTPTTWQPKDLTVVLVHGLCSSHRASHMVRLAQTLWQRGIRAVRMNMRGCGSGLGLARQMYHSGRSEDVYVVVNALQQETPESSFALIGFSLGGNQVLKLAGELGKSTPGFLKQVMAVCPPADLGACSRLLSRPSNWLYDQHFVRELKMAATLRQRLFPDLEAVALPRKLTLYGFDQLYTAPQNGFRDAEDYYARCSAAPLVSAASIPCHILFALDDPFIDGTVFDNKKLPSNIEVKHTARGGHVGFFAAPNRASGLHWLDAQLLTWLELSDHLREQSLSYAQTHNVDAN
jgi:uncharacterized protein